MKAGDVEYSYTCLTKHCKIVRSFGAAKLRCETMAARHRQRFPHHVIAIRESRVLHIFGEATLPLPGLCEHGRAADECWPVDSPPF